MVPVKRLLLIALFILPCLAWAAAPIASTTAVFEANASGSTNNAGGFDPGATFTTNDLSCTSATGNTPDCTSASTYTFVAGDAGNWLYIQSGTNWTPGWYPIICSAGTAGFGSGDTTCAAAHVHVYAGTTLSNSVQPIQTNAALGYPTPKYGVNTVAGIATTASPASGVFSVDYSQKTTDRWAGSTGDLAGATATTACTVSSATHPFNKIDVGQFIHITAGTNWTAGFYEITAVDGSHNATLNPVVCGSTASPTSGTFYEGGAYSFNSASQDPLFAGIMSASGGNRMFFKTGNFTVAGTSGFGGGASQKPNIAEGYQTLRGDSPASSGATENRPVINAGANVFAQNLCHIYNLVITGTAASTLSGGANSVIYNSKVINTSTTASRNAIGGAGGLSVINSEAISYRGNALATGANSMMITSSYFHDSDVCITSAATANVIVLKDSILAGCVTANLKYTAAATAPQVISNDTFYGSENHTSTGYGIDFSVTGTTIPRVRNSIFYGFATDGVHHFDSAQTSGYDNYNNYFNNAADVSGWIKGSNDSALNPTFGSVAQVVVTGGTGNSSTQITKTGAFGSITPLVDYVYIVSGTGCTAGYYGIASSTTNTIVTDISNGCSSTDVSLQITTGHNFAIGNAALKGTGFPGQFQGGLTTGHNSIGAVQPPAGTGQIVTGVVY